MADAISRILIIKHGALGDIILASAGFKAIRHAYPHAHITCLTGKAYGSLLAQCPWIDEVQVDTKPKFWNMTASFALSKQLNAVLYDLVFDLQNSTRSHSYRWLFNPPKPVISRSASRNDRFTKHAHTRLVEQLRNAGMSDVPLPDISWLGGDISMFSIPQPYALIAAGGAPHRPEKRWPAEHFAQLCSALVARGITPVLIGTDAEADVLARIQTLEPKILSLAGKTSFGQIGALARNAVCAVGNDTGPMHIIAAAGAPCTVLFSHASSPERSAPVGEHVQAIQYNDLSQLGAEEVLKTLPAMPVPQKSTANA